MLHIRTLPIALVLLASAGCSSPGSPPLDRDVPQDVLAGLPPVPVEKETSVESTLVLEGRDTSNRSPGAPDFASALALPAGEGELKWGMWIFKLPDRDRMRPLRLELECGVLIGEIMYVAIGRPGTRCWEFFGEVTPDAPNASFEIPPEGYISQVDRVYAAACTYNGNTGLISRVSLVTESDTHYAMVDEGGIEGVTSLVVVSGRPAIAYCKFSRLMFVRANDALGTTWGDPIIVFEREDLGSTGSSAKMLIVDGHPAICFYDGTDLNLRYVRALGPSGAFWDEPVTVDAEERMGARSSIRIINGRPAICYSDTQDGNLRYCRAQDQFGNAWGAPQVLDSLDDVGQYCTMEVVQNRPAICYLKEGPGARQLRFIRAGDADGSAWGEPQTLPLAHSVWGNLSLKIVDGRPAVAYQNTVADQLAFIRATDDIGSSWGASIDLLDHGNLGTDSSLAIINGRPAVSCSQWPADDLFLIEAADSAGSSWEAPKGIDLRFRTGHGNSLAAVDGMPAISYCNIDTYELMYVRMLE